MLEIFYYHHVSPTRQANVPKCALGAWERKEGHANPRATQRTLDDKATKSAPSLLDERGEANARGRTMWWSRRTSNLHSIQALMSYRRKRGLRRERGKRHQRQDVQLTGRFVAGLPEEEVSAFPEPAENLFEEREAFGVVQVHVEPVAEHHVHPARRDGQATGCGCFSMT